MMQDRFSAALITLPSLGSTLAAAHRQTLLSAGIFAPGDPRDELLAELSDNPDSVRCHKPNWHQYGIVTHTRNVIAATGMQAQLDPDGITRPVIDALSQEMIDHRSKWELFVASMIFHDIGKFQPHLRQKHGSWVTVHTDHEKRSEIILRSAADGSGEASVIVQSMLDALSATPAQADYMATCVGLHYQFGRLRDIAKHRPDGYSLSFIDSESFRDACTSIAAGHPPFAREIGLYFLFDSAGKLEFSLEKNFTTQEEITAFRPQWEAYVASNGLPSALVNAFAQYPVNRCAAMQYIAGPGH